MSRHHRAVGWGGPVVSQMRQRVNVRIWSGETVRCWRCTEPIGPTDEWDLGHREDLAGDYSRAFDPANLAPEHRACSRGAGARVTNELRRTRALRSRKWL